MSYVQDDLTQIRKAIKEYAMGERVGEVWVSTGGVEGGSRRVRYSEVSMNDLRDLESSIIADLTPRRPRYRRFISSKGF